MKFNDAIFPLIVGIKYEHIGKISTFLKEELVPFILAGRLSEVKLANRVIIYKMKNYLNSLGLSEENYTITDLSDTIRLSVKYSPYSLEFHNFELSIS